MSEKVPAIADGRFHTLLQVSSAIANQPNLQGEESTPWNRKSRALL
jgi:hypothetical protein